MAIRDEHSMSYDALMEILNTYTTRVRYIKTENNTIALNQRIEGQPFILTVNDIECEVFDTYEFIKVKSFDPFNRKVYFSLIRMNDIRGVVIADKDTDVIDGFRC